MKMSECSESSMSTPGKSGCNKEMETNDNERDQNIDQHLYETISDDMQQVQRLDKVSVKCTSKIYFKNYKVKRTE